MGDGFDLSEIPDPENPENFLNELGKGIMMTLNAFDDVKYNDKGNCVTLLKYSDSYDRTKPLPKELESFELVSEYNRATKMKKRIRL